MQLPEVVAASALSMDPAGSFQAGIPVEGGLAWGLSWRMTTGMAYRLRNGCSYAPLMKHEHVNTAAEIESVIQYFFARGERIRFPCGLASLALYEVIKAYEPRIDRAREYLRTTSSTAGTSGQTSR